MTASEVVWRRVRELRDERKWSAREFAERCTAAGLESFTGSVVANAETGRRRFVTWEEVLVIADVFGVALEALVVPESDAAWVRYGAVETPAARLRSAVRFALPFRGMEAPASAGEAPEVVAERERLIDALRQVSRRSRSQAQPVRVTFDIDPEDVPPEVLAQLRERAAIEDAYNVGPYPGDDTESGEESDDGTR